VRTVWGDWPYLALKVDKMGLADQISAITLSIIWLSPRATHRWSFHCCKFEVISLAKLKNLQW
jgi:hypothetical protein